MLLGLQSCSAGGNYQSNMVLVSQLVESMAANHLIGVAVTAILTLLLTIFVVLGQQHKPSVPWLPHYKAVLISAGS